MLKYRYIIVKLIILLPYILFAQVDEVKIDFIIGSAGETLHVKQEFEVSPRNGKVHLYLWANAYQPKSVLSKTKLKGREDNLYFSAVKDRGGVNYLKIHSLENEELEYRYLNSELIEIEVPEVVDRYKFTANYELKVPRDIYTGYGRSNNGNLYLKYLFIQPAVYNELNQVVIQNFKDFESLTANKTNYKIHFVKPEGTSVFTNLKKEDENTYEGRERSFFEIVVNKDELFQELNTSYGDVIIGFPIDSADIPALKEKLQRQLKFLNKFLEPLQEPIFITERLGEKIGYKYVDNFKIPLIGEYKFFDKDIWADLKLLPVLFTTYIERSVHVDNRKNHWIKNGLSTFLQLRFLEEYYPDLPIAGNLLKDIHLYTFYPLTLFEASKVNFKDRFVFAYRNSLQENYDQPINTPFDELGNNNQKVVSYYKSGLAFQYLESYVGRENMDKLLKAFFNLNQTKLLTVKDIHQFFEVHLKLDLQWFFKDLIETDEKIDYAIEKVKSNKDHDKVVSVNNYSSFSGPFRFYGYNRKGERVLDEWYASPEKKVKFIVSDSSIVRFSVNEDMPLPEFNYDRNYYNTESLLNRKVKFGFFTDMEFSQWQQYFFIPHLNFNNYDKFQFGVEFNNRTIMPQPIEFSFQPKFSIGTGKITGESALSYNYFPDHGIIRTLRLSGAVDYSHYAQDLAYFKYHIGALVKFRSPFRSLHSHRLFGYFNDIRRDLPINPTPIEQELKHYSLLNIGYDYWNYHIIHERKANFFIQMSNKFQKVFGEFYYRYRFKKNKRLGIRLFAGIFLNHSLQETQFYDFGLDHITDYMYRFKLFGRSETSGIFYQQYVLSEGGFKSNFNIKANQLLTTLNFEYPIWNVLEAYTDFGVYKNKGEPSHFVYDSGLSLKIIPDFFELYFPLQSSLGFEPSMGNYLERIRFTLSLDLGKVREYRRRGNFE